MINSSKLKQASLGFLFSMILGGAMVIATTTAHADLQVPMKELGSIFKALGPQASDATKNADSALKAARMNELFKLSLKETPESIASMPAAQQTAALNQYQEWIQKEIDLSAELKLAFEANDNAKALKVMNEMNSVRKQGHTEFKLN